MTEPKTCKVEHREVFRDGHHGIETHLITYEGGLCPRCNFTAVNDRGQCNQCGFWESPKQFLNFI